MNTGEGKLYFKCLIRNTMITQSKCPINVFKLVIIKGYLAILYSTQTADAHSILFFFHYLSLMQVILLNNAGFKDYLNWCLIQNAEFSFIPHKLF